MKLNGSLIFLPKIGWVKYFKSREVLGPIKTVTVSRTPTGRYYVSVLEDLHVSGMMKNRKLSLAIAEVGWYNFRLMLEYKCEWYGKNFAVVPRFYPSSKTCNHCKAKLDRLPLQVREWQCPSCGAVNDRDHNAAKNIKEQGVALLLDPTAGDTAGRVKSARAA